jgi:hypothetical protein
MARLAPRSRWAIGNLAPASILPPIPVDVSAA